MSIGIAELFVLDQLHVYATSRANQEKKYGKGVKNIFM